VSTHAPLQSDKSELQRSEQLPLRQSGVPFFALGQTLPQSPQLATSELRFAQ
jgi:hypothetical protein